ncbi:retrotransposon protein, putative, ty1-copia subclass [Tanacetum coccineum]
MTTSSANNSVFRGFFEKQKLTGPNFIDWYRQLRIVLSIDDKLNYLEQPLPPAPVAPAGQHVAPEILAAHTAWVKGSKEIAGLMLMTMEPEIQRNLENLHANDMLKELKALFAQQAEQELLQTTRDFHACKQEEGQSVSSYVLRMKGYIDNLERLGHPVTLGLAVSLILIGLRKEFDRGQNQGNGKNKHAYAPKPKIPPPPKREDPAKDSICHECGETGHWKRNCPQYLAELLKKKKNAASGAGSGSGIFANESSIYAICKQRAMIDLDFCSLVAIVVFDTSLRNALKLQHDGLINSTDLRVFFKMVPCRYGRCKNTLHTSSGKGQDLLGLIHTVYVPFKITFKAKEQILLTFMSTFYAHPGCEALVKRDTLTKPDKLEPRSIKCIFIGYPKETMGYSFYYPPENKVLVARNAEFLENSLIDQEASGSLEDLEIIQEEDTHPSIDTSLNHEEDDLEMDEPQSDIIPIRRSTRTRRPTDRMCLYIDAEEHELGDLGEPANYKAALLDPESDKWLNAMNVEMQSMKDNEVWILVELPPNGKTVGSKWLFKKKTDMDGAVHTYKARLVVKGYTQTPGIDYEETFSPVADIRAIRILIAIAAYYDYEIWQMDVKTAFLNGYLNEEVYMEQPEGFVNPKYPNRVCKLKRSIYGLKQASRQWNKRFDDEIKKFGFSQNADEPCVYLKASGSNVTFLILCFAMKDLGEAAYILGIKIYRDRSRRLISLCQSAYIEKILKRFTWRNSKREKYPMQVKLRLSNHKGASTPAELKRMQSVPYASAVGSIILLGFSAYTDAGYLTDADDLKSQTGYVFVLNGGAVDWRQLPSKHFATIHLQMLSLLLTFDDSKKPYGCLVHFRTKVQYLREVYLNFGDIKLEKFNDDNLADPFTKALAFPKHSELTRNIGMLSASSFM